MWLGLHRQLSATVEGVLRERADEICHILAETEPNDYFDPRNRVGGEAGLFGKAVWPLANDAVIDLVCEFAEKRGVPCEVPVELSECRRRWKERLLGRWEEIRVAALIDYAARIERHVESFSIEPPDCDLDYALGNLDVFKCFAVGADRLWPQLTFESRLDSLLEEPRRNWLRKYPRLLREGGFKDEGGEVWWTLSVTSLEAEEIPWLPASFWWRHLPELVRPLMGK